MFLTAKVLTVEVNTTTNLCSKEDQNDFDIQEQHKIAPFCLYKTKIHYSDCIYIYIYVSLTLPIFMHVLITVYSTVQPAPRPGCSSTYSFQPEAHPANDLFMHLQLVWINCNMRTGHCKALGAWLTVWVEHMTSAITFRYHLTNCRACVHKVGLLQKWKL